MKTMKILFGFTLLSLGSIATARFLSTHRSISAEISKQKVASRFTSDDWDYADEGNSWTTGSCSSLENQSPINVSTTVAAQLKDTDTMFFKYPVYETPVTLKNDGRNLYTYIDNDDGHVGGIFMGQEFPLILTSSYYIYKVVIHTPSEHTYGGVKVPCEVQLYHRKEFATITNGEPDPGDTAVVSIGFTESTDEASSFLLSLVHGGVPDQRGAEVVTNSGYPSALNFNDMYRPIFGSTGEKAGFWEYSGSLTQPPCSTGVRWFVRNQPLNAKKATLDLLSQATIKASGGVPTSVRKLHHVGGRPVFPRFATEATNLQTFDEHVPDEFKVAIRDAKIAQAALRKGLEEDLGAKGSTLRDPHKLCLNDMGDLVENLATAKRVQETSCANMEAAKNTLDSMANSVSGPGKLEASSEYATHKKSCEDETARVNALETERYKEAAACDALKSTGSTSK